MVENFIFSSPGLQATWAYVVTKRPSGVRRPSSVNVLFVNTLVPSIFIGSKPNLVCDLISGISRTSSNLGEIRQGAAELQTFAMSKNGNLDSLTL